MDFNPRNKHKSYHTMKIDAILERTIKAAAKQLPGWMERNEINSRNEREAIARFNKLPKHSRRLTSLRAKRQKALRELKETEIAFQDLGLTSNGNNIGDSKKFAAAGGIEPVPFFYWEPNKVLALCAKAETEDQLNEILLKHGIHWK